MEHFNPSKVKPLKSGLSIAPASSIQDNPVGISNLKTDVIVNHLEANFALRQMPLTDRLKKGMLR